jgi:transcriptional regulator with XRE-family HTH domain
MALGSKLTALRLKKGNSLQEVADAVGVSKAHIWELEKGRSKNPSADLIKRLADYFGQSVEYLIGGEKTKATDVDEAQLFYRDLKSLGKEDRDLVLHTIKMLKERKR